MVAGDPISKAYFDTTPYNYQPTSIDRAVWYWMYKSNVCWDVYIRCASASFSSRCYIRIDFYDYDSGTWVPIASDAGSQDGQNYQYRLDGGQTFRFFHNCLNNYNDSAYSANIKEKDRIVTNGGFTYDSRGFSLWRIGFYFTSQTVGSGGNDFNINSFGPGYLTDAEYNDICKDRLIKCGGKGVSGSDDQHIVTGTPQDSDFNTRFLPSLFSPPNDTYMAADLDRQFIPEWEWART